MASKNVDPTLTYDWQLKQSIQAQFVRLVKPMSVLTYFGKYSLIFNEADYTKIRAVIHAQGDHDGAVELLDRLCCYAEWFSCLTRVLRDPDVRLAHVAESIEKVKTELDIRLGVKTRDEEARNLQEEACQKNQTELEAESSKPEQTKQDASKIIEARSHEKKMTGKVYIELKNLDYQIEEERRQHQIKIRQLEQEKDCAIEQERKRFEEEAKRRENLDYQKEEERRQHQIKIRQLEQEKDCALEQERKRFEEEAKRRENLDYQTEEERRQHQIKIRQLEQEKENLEKIIQQERRHQKELKEETRQKDQLITNLRNSIQSLQVQRTQDATKTQTEISHLLSTNTHSDGVLLWNYYVTYRMTEEYPDIAKKLGLTECDRPSHLEAAAKWAAVWFSFWLEECEEVKQHGVTKAKEKIQTRLRKILNNVNMMRKENKSDVIIKYELQFDIRAFFSCCYWCIIGLDTHGVNSVKECLMYIKDSITENLDQLVEEFGGEWNDLMSYATWKRYLEAEIKAERARTSWLTRLFT